MMPLAVVLAAAVVQAPPAEPPSCLRDRPVYLTCRPAERAAGAGSVPPTRLTDDDRRAWSIEGANAARARVLPE